MIGNLVVFGVGLIGASVGLALKEAGAVGRVVGIGRSRENLQRALDLGAIDEVATDAREAVPAANLVLLAVPVGQVGAAMQAVAPWLQAATVVTDVGSTKRDVIEEARCYLAPHLARFVPGHPIAGAEQSGAVAARAALFQGRNVVLTPLPENDARAIAQVESLWRACGALVSTLPAAQHDAIFGAVSHLPHLAAFALVAEIAGRGDAPELFRFAASGFRDFTRIAGSSPEMWRDICLANRDVLLDELDRYLASLANIKSKLARGDADGLEAIFAAARSARRAWLAEP
ncbi:MAG: prephenate dehydrogenase/arogenate dehydrogenase family protein [Betaproteobacteria bacterium]|nr:prephenate dehydrogenase/arogenate dehydrogenase family protein [Betaproteobacteria bacterium]